jgi:hypothetical protein
MRRIRRLQSWRQLQLLTGRPQRWLLLPRQHTWQLHMWRGTRLILL